MRHILLFAAYFVPALTLAQEAEEAQDISGIMNTLLNLLDTATVLIVSLAVVYFLWGIFKYVSASSDEKRTEGRKVMIHGIIALFVMVSVWGLVNVLSETFNLSPDNPPQPPPMPGME